MVRAGAQTVNRAVGVVGVAGVAGAVGVAKCLGRTTLDAELGPLG
jgi:hypothetical protein